METKNNQRKKSDDQYEEKTSLATRMQFSNCFRQDNADQSAVIQIQNVFHRKDDPSLSK